MGSLAGITSETDALVALSRLSEGAAASSSTRLDRVHAFLAEGTPDVTRMLLDTAHAKAARMLRAGGGNLASETAAAQVYAADVVAGLAAEGVLDPGDTRVAVGAVAETCGVPLAAASFDLFLRAVHSPALLELPPVVGAELQLRLLVHLDVASEISIWRRAVESDVECLVAVGADPGDRYLRAEARAAIAGRTRMQLIRRSGLRTARIYSFGAVGGAIVARLTPDPGREELDAYLDVAADALAPLLEREVLLTRNAARERALTVKYENRLTSLGLDLHDGPVQDVLALAAETRELRDQVYPFIADSHRDLAYGRFDDLVARIVELDRTLREAAHSLEGRSIASRPLAETLHREVDAFASRTGIAASVEIHGDPESLGPQQRIALFRAIQEGLTNVKEHSGADTVDVRLQMRRNTVEVKVTDDGHGFEVSRSLALAAQRGRLGLVGMSERMRMLGGSFDVDSRVGGPTVLRFSLPLWMPFEPLGGEH